MMNWGQLLERVLGEGGKRVGGSGGAGVTEKGLP